MIPHGPFGKPIAAVAAVSLVILSLLAVWDISADYAVIKYTAERRVADAIDTQASLEAQDLLAQQEMAIWAESMFWATAASLLVSLGALIGLFMSLSQTRRAIADNRQLGEAEIQAYVHASRLELEADGSLLLYCLNNGSTPATHFSISATVQRVKVRQVTKSIRFDTQRFVTWTGLAVGVETSVGIDVENKAVIHQFINRQFEGDEVLLVSGQIVYCTVFNHDHETQFAFYAHSAAQKKFIRPTSNLRSYYRLNGDGA